MRVKIVTTASSPALSSPLVLPWRRRTFLFRRRTARRRSSISIHEKKPSTARKFRGLGGRSALKIDSADVPSPVRSFPISQGVKRKQSSLSVDEEPSLRIGVKTIHQNDVMFKKSAFDQGAALESIVQDADRYHKKRRIQRMRALQTWTHKQVAANARCEEPKNLLPSFPTSPCARTPSMKKKMLQLTGLSSISPISRPAKKQRFL